VAVLKGGTYAKKGKETSHRNPKAGHMQKKARKPPTEIRKQDICKKGEGTSHRNPKAGHMQKKARKPPTEIQKRDIIRKKICICPNKRKMWDIVKRKSAYVPTKGKCGT
jgi:hypothetical protein